jgi:hypothetical protein
MKFACHKARALSRVAIIIFAGMDELGIIINDNEKITELLLMFILACQAPTWIEVHRASARMCIAGKVAL